MLKVGYFISIDIKKSIVVLHNEKFNPVMELNISGVFFNPELACTNIADCIARSHGYRVSASTKIDEARKVMDLPDHLWEVY